MKACRFVLHSLSHGLECDSVWCGFVGVLNVLKNMCFCKFGGRNVFGSLKQFSVCDA